MENTEKQLSKTVKYGYGVPSFGFQVFVNMEVMFFAAFLTDFALLPVGIAGTVLMVTSIFDIVWVPTAGILLEKSNMKWGRYRSWLLVGPPFAALFFILQFTKIGDHMMNAILITVGFVVSHLIWNIFYAAHIAMNSSMTKNQDERIAMASNRGMFNALGSIVFSFFGSLAVLNLGPAGAEHLGYTYTVVVTGIIMVLCYWFLFVITKDYGFHGLSKPGEKEEDKMPVSTMLKQIFVNPPLIGLLLSELGRYLGRFIIFGMAFYYFTYVLENPAGIPVFMTGLNFLVFFAAIAASPIAKKIGEKKTYMLSFSLFIIGLLIVWFVDLEYIPFLAVMFIAYIGYGMPDALGVSMYAATVEYGHWKTGENARGFIMSLISFPIKTAIFVRSVIITAILGSVNYVAGMETTPELVTGIKMGMSLIPALFLLAGLIIFFFLYTLTPERLAQIKEEITAREEK
ncbi:MAG TPA: sugar transporter [Eubacteriaceae bacterium]|nr:sugar transporter [Eubacteriaceae bacterium]